MPVDPKELSTTFAAEEIGKLRTETESIAKGNFVPLSYEAIEVIMEYCYIKGVSKGIDIMGDEVRNVFKKD